MDSWHPGAILAGCGLLAFAAASVCSGIPMAQVTPLAIAGLAAAACLADRVRVSARPARTPDHLTTLYESARAMSSLPTPESLLGYLAEAAAEATGSQLAVVLVADRQEMTLRAAAGYQLDAADLSDVSIPLTQDNLCGRVVLTGQESALGSPKQLCPELSALLERPGVRGVLAIPISSNLEVFGLVLLATSRRRHARSVLPLARSLAGLAAVFLERNRLLSDLDRELHELKWLTVITDKILLEEGPEEVVKAVIETGLYVLETDALALFLFDDNQDRLVCAGARGVDPSDLCLDTKEQQAMLLDVFGWQDPLAIPDAQTLPDGDPLREPLLGTGMRSVVGLQLRLKGRPMGLLAALYREPRAPGATWTDLHRMFAVDAAVALNYSHLLEQSRSLVRELESANARLEQQAVHDGLTGLWNHRAFHQRLAEQVHRVGRYGETFSLVMLDVDHFKAYNDAYGHQEGDLALQQIAQVISSQLRESDLAARYGGEEFTIIMPHIPKSRARTAVERIRKAIDTHQFSDGKLTVSAGIAECPADGVTGNEVLEKADRALYHAKLTGRNRVCIWAASPQEHSGSEPSREPRPISVLVVENDQDSRNAVEHALRSAGYELHRASTSQEALKLLRSRKFDIMLSDALILGTDGMEVLGFVSSIHPTMPVVLTTIASMAGVARDAMRHGVTDLLVKPFSEHELPVVIERNLERKRLERKLLLERSTGILLQAIDALVAAIDAKDHLTAGHSTRVTHLSLAIADTLELPSEERYTLELGARLHDIGKLSLPDSALNKPGPLSEEEWAAMRRHPAVGSQIVGSIEELSYVATIVRHHHERLDGKGYPDGLQGDAIPLLARIIAVADAFEAMTSDRSFRPKMSVEEAIAELRSCVGTHYSLEIVEALVESLKSAAIEGQGFNAAA